MTTYRQLAASINMIRQSSKKSSSDWFGTQSLIWRRRHTTAAGIVASTQSYLLAMRTRLSTGPLSGFGILSSCPCKTWQSLRIVRGSSSNSLSCLTGLEKELFNRAENTFEWKARALAETEMVWLFYMVKRKSPLSTTEYNWLLGHAPGIGIVTVDCVRCSSN